MPRALSGAIHVKSEKEYNRLKKRMTRQQRRTKIDEELQVDGAFKTIEALEKKVEKLEDTLAGMVVTVNKLWAWKQQQEMKDG